VGEGFSFSDLVWKFEGCEGCLPGVIWGDPESASASRVWGIRDFLLLSSYSFLFISLLPASSISVASALPYLLPRKVIRVDFPFSFKVYFNLLPFKKDHEHFILEFEKKPGFCPPACIAFSFHFCIELEPRQDKTKHWAHFCF
jgi:hypothetical protein